MENVSGYVDVILDSLDKKNKVLDEIIEFNISQKELLSAEEIDADEFEESLDVKASLITKLEELDNGFTSVYDRVKDELVANQGKYTSQIARMKELISQITDKTVKIQTEEARNKKLAEDYFAKAKQENKMARKNNAMANNYYKSMSQVDLSPQFFDKQK